MDDARISLKHALVLCKQLKGKRTAKARRLLEDLIAGTRSINGKYYTNASKKLLELLKTAEANAAQKGLDAEKLFVAAARANKGRTFIRPRSRAKLRGRRAKATNVEIVLEER